MMEYVEIGLRWLFAAQMVLWGLNGFFHWMQIPPSDPKIDRFVGACIESKFIMPTVKLLEIVFGLFLLFDFLTPFSLFVFAPLMFVISGLHILHNPKPWSVLVPCTLPYLILLFLHADTLLRMVNAAP